MQVYLKSLKLAPQQSLAEGPEGAQKQTLACGLKRPK